MRLNLGVYRDNGKENGNYYLGVKVRQTFGTDL